MDILSNLTSYIPEGFFGTFNLNVGRITLAPSYIQAGLIILLLFLLVLTLARVRRHFLEWSIKGSVFGIFLGFLLALILEGFLILGGRTALTELLGWKNAPKPVAEALDSGKAKLVDVLGIESEIPESRASQPLTSQEIIEAYQSLERDEAKKVESSICTP